MATAKQLISADSLKPVKPAAKQVIITILCYAAAIIFLLLCFINSFRIIAEGPLKADAELAFLHPQFDLNCGILLVLALLFFNYKLVVHWLEMVKITKIKVSEMEISMDYWAKSGDVPDPGVTAKSELLKLLGEKLQAIGKQLEFYISSENLLPQDVGMADEILASDQRMAAFLAARGYITPDFMGSYLTLNKYVEDMTDPNMTDNSTLIKAIGLAFALLKHITPAEGEADENETLD